MRIAYALLVHRDALQVKRLIHALMAPGVCFYVHLDKKALADASFQILHTLPETTVLERSIDVKWGGYSIVEASLCLLKTILESPQPIDQIVLMSGQCYPVKPNAEIMRFFRAQRGFSFFYSEPAESSWWSEAYARFKQYHPTDWSFRGRYRLAGLINKLLPERSFPMKGKMYGGPGSGWWSLAPAHARYLTDHISDHDELEKFSRTTWAPDEFFLQTILYNSPFSAEVKNRLLWFMEWSHGQPSPNVLNLKHLNALKKTDALFARKVCPGDSDELLNALDVYLHEKPGVDTGTEG